MREDVLPGITRKVKITLPDGRDVKFYITVNKFEGKIFEVFINVREADLWEHLVVVTRFISRMLQAGIPISTIIDDLKNIHSPNTGHFAKQDGWMSSIYAHLGALLEKENP